MMMMNSRNAGKNFFGRKNANDYICYFSYFVCCLRSGEVLVSKQGEVTKNIQEMSAEWKARDTRGANWENETLSFEWPLFIISSYFFVFCYFIVYFFLPWMLPQKGGNKNGKWKSGLEAIYRAHFLLVLRVELSGKRYHCLCGDEDVCHHQKAWQKTRENNMCLSKEIQTGCLFFWRWRGIA